MTDLTAVARTLTSGGRGILAADESIATMSKRLEAEGIPGTESNRRDYRELLITAPEASRYASGIILSDETFRQSLSDGRPVPQACHDVGILPGIKVDTGTSVLPGQGGAMVTEGLDTLGKRFAAYAESGAAFAKWRAVIDVATTTPYALRANAAALARYAALAQEHGIVPIVEPEVLATGDHSIERCATVSADALTALFAELGAAGVDLSGIVLKPNLVTPGLDAAEASASEVAQATYDVLRRVVPESVVGIAFLSGGHSTERSVAYLTELNRLGGAPWSLTFSFGRALVSDALHTWAGSPDNVVAAQQVLLRNLAAASEAARSVPVPA